MDKFLILNENLTAWLKARGLYKDYRKHGIIRDWQNIVGRSIALNTLELRFKKDILILKVRNTLWKKELSLIKYSLKKKVNDYLGFEGVKEIKIKI